MAYPNSDPVDRLALEASGCLTTLPVRCSKYQDLANSTSREFWLEWNNAGIKGDLRHSSFDPKGNAFALSVPECLPERVEVGTRIFDLGFYNDDLLDTLDDREDAFAINPSWADGYESIDRKPVAITQVKGSGAKRQLEAKTMLQATAIDREAALDMMKTWKQFLQDSENEQKFKIGSKSWEDWVQYRHLDGALATTHSICCFGMGVLISDEEKATVRHIVYPVLTVAIMINDYYSFEKEYEAYIVDGKKRDMSNSVWFLMQHEGLGESQAKQRVLEEALESEKNYTIARNAYEKAHPDMAPSVAKYLDAAMFLATGAWYWSSFCSRYHYINRPEKVPDRKSVDIPLNIKKNAPLDVGQAFGPGDTCKGSLAPLQHFLTTTAGMKAGQYFTDVNKTDLSDEIVLAPYDYLSSLPSKGVRATAVDALDIWLNVPASSLAPIRLLVEYLHSASLMLDDIEDHSPLRRGQPATHTIFGSAQTINSANYLFLLSVIELHKLPSTQCTGIYERQLKRLHIGQSLDINWTNHVACPTIAEYIDMVDHKTGGLFCLIGNLMQAESLDNLPGNTTIEHLMILLGRYFQIRDDYQNLVSTDYAVSKGFCEDLDEGKYSLALIHALQYPGPETLQLRAILQERSRKGAMTLEMKKLVREMIENRRSLDYVRSVLKDMESAVEKEILRIEEATGITNYVIRLLFERLKVE